MKLYDTPRNSFVKIENGVIIDFNHIDGAFSLCYVPEGICHVSCTEEVEIVTKQDYLDYWRNKMNKIKGFSWDGIDEKYTWVAQDFDGDIYVFNGKPVLAPNGEKVWCCEDKDGNDL